MISTDSASAPFVDPIELRRSVSDFLNVSPLRGLIKSAVLTAGAILWTWLALSSSTWFGFALFALCAGWWAAAFLITTHDAIHHTLTGIPWFDEVMPRLISYPLLWTHGLYAELHLLHHQMNSSNLDDPERVTPSREEYENAGLVGRWYFRNQLLLETMVFGGFGMIYSALRHGFRHFRKNESIRRQMMVDAAGIVGTNLVIYTLAISAGMGWRYLLFYLIVERVVGFVMKLRAHVEHYGLWGQNENFFETQVLHCRNTDTSSLVSLYFNGLNFHSAHHTFVEIPFYSLGDANARILSRYESSGAKPERAKGYLHTLAHFSQNPCYIVNAQNPREARVEPIPLARWRNIPHLATPS